VTEPPFRELWSGRIAAGAAAYITAIWQPPQLEREGEVSLVGVKQKQTLSVMDRWVLARPGIPNHFRGPSKEIRLPYQLESNQVRGS